MPLKVQGSFLAVLLFIQLCHMGSNVGDFYESCSEIDISDVSILKVVCRITRTRDEIRINNKDICRRIRLWIDSVI